jgi:hypothetical protein
MLRMRFLPGLLVGLVLGLPLGVISALWLVSGDETAARHAGEIDDLSRRLERAEKDKERMNRQLEDFGGLAERMAKSFEDLERRFRALQEQQHAPAPPPPLPTPSEVPLPPTA